MDSTYEGLHTSSEPSLEEDIVDQLCTVDLNDEIPARPTSRLGFNRNEDDDPPLTEEGSLESAYHEFFYEAETLSTYSARLDEDESDITTFMLERDSATKIPTRPRPPRLAEDCIFHHDVRRMSENEDLDSESQSNYSSGEGSDADEDCTTSPSHATPLPLPEESDWSIPSQFSCLPSPLSSRYIPPDAFSYRHIPQRHRYRHHGHSRHGLLHLKWFWASREDTWSEHKARMFEAKAYDSLSIFSSISPRLGLPGGCIPSDPADTPQPPPSPPMARLPPLSIHPRRGDLGALHDPYCMHIDRYFVGMPLWTMSKTLWMFDVHMATGELQAGQQDAEDDLFEDRSEGESIQTSDSHAFSDDSDSTLVESDNEAEHPRHTGDANQEDITADPKGPQASELEADASSSNIPITGDPKRSPPRSTSTSSKFLCSPPWPTNWYRRWEILLQLCVKKTNQSAISSSTKTQRFFIGDDWDDDVSEEDEAPEEEEEMEEVPKKNVLVVVNDECLSGRYLRHWF
ncbi:hypothetical protein C0995_012609 [Termitomyces sp. Mi166|nr:hypothetical protein C0995_012609 [Termitomyces sp. Mi166\